MSPPPQALAGEACPAFLPALCYGDSCIVTPETDRSPVRVPEAPDA